MAEALGTVVGVIAFGLNLATTLQTYTELTREANDALHDVVFEVNATASALRQLQGIVDTDKDISDKSARVLSDSGVREIEALAAKCQTVYKTIVKLVQKATDADSGSSDAAATLQHALDPACLKPLNVFQRARWPWLTPRIERCQQQLRWLKISLLVTLQIANLAVQQMGRDHNAIPTQDDNLAEVVEALQERQTDLATRLAGASGAVTELDVAVESQAAAVHVKSASGDAGSVVWPGVGASKPSEASCAAYADVGKTKGVRQAAATDIMDAMSESSSMNQNRPAPEQMQTSMTLNTCTGTCPENTGDPLRNLLASEQLDMPCTHGFRAPGVAPLNAAQPEANGLPKPDATFRAKEKPSTAIMAAGTQAACSSRSLESHHKSPEIHLSGSSDVKIRTNTSETGKRRSTIPIFSRARRARDHLSQIFGEDKKVSQDSPSRTLEAFVAEHGKVRKVPFGHDRLVFGLNQVHKYRTTSTWADYLNLTSEKQDLIDKITELANRTSYRAMSLLTFYWVERQDGSDAVLAFFSLNESQEPVTFIDAKERKHFIPFGVCQTHKGFHGFVLAMYKDTGDLAESASKGEFERYVPYGPFEPIHPMLWSASVQPGTILRLAGHGPADPYASAQSYNRSNVKATHIQPPSSPGHGRHPLNAPLPSRALSTMQGDSLNGVDDSVGRITSYDADAFIKEIEAEFMRHAPSGEAIPEQRLDSTQESLSDWGHDLFFHDDARSESAGVDQDGSVSDDGQIVDFDAEAEKMVASVTDLLSRLTNAPRATT